MTVQRWGYRELVKLMIENRFHFKVIEKTSQESDPKIIAHRASSFKKSLLFLIEITKPKWRYLHKPNHAAKKFDSFD